MRSGQNTTRSPEGPGAKCCLGVAYFNRTLERSGIPPKCLGLGQLKNGDQGNDDVRVLGSATGDFQYYCLGYSTHPTGAQPSGSGEATQMPYCEGVEIAVTEEQGANAPVPLAEGAPPSSSSSAGALGRHQPALPSVDHGSGGAPLPPSTSDPSDSPEDRGGGGVRDRFRRNLVRNAGSLMAAVTGERLPQLPVQMRTYGSVAEAGRSLVDTASSNAHKMWAMADFIRFRTMDAVKLATERVRNPEEETE